MTISPQPEILLVDPIYPVEGRLRVLKASTNQVG